jgi:hypothetical protein
MILAFADDSTVTVYDTITQVIVDCEGVDVEDGLFIFTDERGYILRPVFTEPNKRGSLFSIKWVSSGFFKLELTTERNVQLLQDIVESRVWVDRGPTSICNQEQLKEAILKANPELDRGG